MHERLGVTESVRQRDRPLAPAQRILVALREHRELGAVAEGHRQLTALGKRLELLDRLPGGALRGGAVTRQPVDARQPSQRRARGQRLAELTPQRQRASPRRRGTLGLVAVVGLLGQQLERRGTLPHREQVLVLEHADQQRLRFAMRARRDRVVSRVEPVSHDRIGVAGRPGVMRQSSRTRLAARERAQHGPVEVPAPRSREGFLNRPPRQLVTEADQVVVDGEQATAFALGEPGMERLSRRCALLQERQRGTGGEHAHQLRHRPRRVGEARGTRENRVPHTRGRAARATGQRLANEERVAARDRAQRRRIDLRAREQSDRLDAQALQLQPLRATSRRRGQRPTQRMVGADLIVAERHHEQRRHGLDAPGDVREHVDRRLVGPMRVLDDADRGTRTAQLVEHDLRGVDAALPELHGEPSHLACDVEERAERARHREVVTRPGQHTRRAPLPGDECPHQARLADTRLAADERDPAMAGHDRSEGGLERGQRILPLEQRRAEMLTAHRPDHSADPQAAQRGHP